MTKQAGEVNRLIGSRSAAYRAYVTVFCDAAAA